MPFHSIALRGGVNLRSLFSKSALIMSFLLALPAAAQFLPLPGSDKQAQVICTGCPGMNIHQQNNDGLKMTPYASPISRHVGRLVDSSSTQSYQNVGFRTARGGKIMSARSARGSAPPRMYMRMGEAIFAWNLNTFFTSSLPGGTRLVKDLPTGNNYARSELEKILLPDAFVYPEARSSGWTPTVGDDQNTYGDMDFDDRGYVYSAMTTHGWAILKDNGETGATQLGLSSPQMYGNINPEVIVALKSGTTYYAAIGDLNGGEIALYNATTPSAPTLATTRKGTQWGIKVWAKNTAGTRLAYVGGDGKLRVFETSAYVSGGAPIIEVSPTTGEKREIQDIKFDEAGNVWIAEGRDSAPNGNVLRRLTATLSGYTENSYNVYGEAFSALKLHVADGYIITSGWGIGSDGQGALDVKVFKIEGATPREIPLGKFFSKYYHRAPSGFGQPQVYPSGYCSTPSLSDVHVIKWNGKLYIMYNAWGIGDVYELEGGGAINANMKSASFGTANPNSKGTGGPFYGDIVTFTATSSVPGSSGLLWDFGNPEAGTGSNNRSSANGAEIQHQYTGLTTAGAITTTKTVTVYEGLDNAITGTLPVTLKLPAPRIGLPGNVTLTASATGLNVLAGDTLTDASDGSVESHFATWNLDGAETNALPTSTFAAGAVGTHTLTFTGSYGRYNATSFAPTGTPYKTPTLSVSYTARPFLFNFKPATKTGNTVNFGATARKVSDTAIVAATTWTAAWSLQKAGVDVTAPQSGVVPIGTVPDFPVSVAIPDGSVLKLTLTVDTGLLSAAAIPYAVYSDSMTLESPDPKITKTGCANALNACSFEAGSLGNKPMTDWTLSWTLLLNGSPVTTGNGTTFSPSIANAGTYTVRLKATKAIFETTVEQQVVVGATLCGPPAPEHTISIHASCRTNCATNTTITFNAQPFGYEPQDCDEWVWTWGDGQSETLKGKTGWLATHKYASNNTYQVKLTTKNTAGSTTVTPITVTVGGTEPPPPPPPTCAAPSTVSFTYTGSKGCKPGTDCKVGEAITFSPKKNGGSLHDCDATSWSFGDSTSSSRTPTKTFNSTGARTVTLTISNTKGSAESSTTINVVPDGSATCDRAPSADGFYLFFRGRDSGCMHSNNKVCTKGEIIDFRAIEYGAPFPAFQGCDRFEWKFGDGGTSPSKEAEHAYTSSAEEFEVSIRVYNNVGSAELKDLVRFTAAPVVPAPELTPAATFPRNGAKGVTMTFTVESNIETTTGWTWDFGDGTPKDTSQAGLVSKTSTITHVFTNAGTRTVTVSARNSLATSTSLTAVASEQVVISDVPQYRFLLPAVIHAPGQNGAAWRTDVQVYYGAPNPAAEPLRMTASFNGTESQLEIARSTFIYDDFVNRLTNGADGQGAVILTTQTPYKPQIWTRTYTVDPSGKTYGQFIPAIELTETTGNSTVTPNAEPSKYYLSGLRHDGRYRTNLGVINITSSDILADVTAYDDLRNPLDHFTLTLAPYTLTPYSVAKIKNVSNRPVSLVLTVPAGKRIVGYASLIDGASNDPVYISAVSDTELAEYTTSITPGVGHIGAWRSDVTIFNPDDRNEVKFDLEYFDKDGFSRGLATNITLGRLQAKNYGDLVRDASLFSPAPPDGVGMLKLTARSQQTVYPLTFSRTYNDKGTGGTFGQGIAGITPSRANVIPGKSAIIAGVRAGANYRTNIGLTNTTGNAISVRVQLLDPVTGAEASSRTYGLPAYASTVELYPFPANITSGAFRIEITGGTGAVWAFASVIDGNSEDPEYVPATLIP